MSSDELLEAYLSSGDDQASLWLERLTTEVVIPTVRRAVNAKLHFRRDSEHREDAFQEAIEQVLSALRRMRERERAPVGKVVGWTWWVAVHVCQSFVRNRFPQWRQLEHAIRYQISHCDEFQTWEHDGGQKLCGSRPRASQPVLSRSKLEALMDTPKVAERLTKVDPSQAETVRHLLAVVFAVAGSPVKVKELIAVVAERSLSRQVNLPDDAERDDDALPWTVAPATCLTAHESLIEREIVGLLWDCVLQLCQEERLALLLGLKDGITVFSDEVSEQQVAAAACMEPDQLGQVPFTDLQIWSHIEATRTKATSRVGAAPKADDPAIVKSRRSAVSNWRRNARRNLTNCPGSRDETIPVYSTSEP